jgi:hypothetical protein
MGWTPNRKHTIYDYLDNAVGWPYKFFEDHSAEELGLEEPERQELMAMQEKARSRATATRIPDEN